MKTQRTPWGWLRLGEVVIINHRGHRHYWGVDTVEGLTDVTKAMRKAMHGFVCVCGEASFAIGIGGPMHDPDAPPVPAVRCKACSEQLWPEAVFVTGTRASVHIGGSIYSAEVGK